MSNLTLLCQVCIDRKEWKEFHDNTKSKEDEIERYCHKLRGTVPDYELSFEEYREQSSEVWKLRQEAIEKIEREDAEEFRFLKEKPEGMTNKQWQKEKSRRRLLKHEEIKQKQLDDKLRWDKNPNKMFIDRLLKVSMGCECIAEGMRQGVFCKTCRLIVKVNEYTLHLFKDAAEGRSTIV